MARIAASLEQGHYLLRKKMETRYQMLMLIVLNHFTLKKKKQLWKQICRKYFIPKVFNDF